MNSALEPRTEKQPIGRVETESRRVFVTGSKAGGYCGRKLFLPSLVFGVSSLVSTGLYCYPDKVWVCCRKNYSYLVLNAPRYR
jgi:hypothetical protein